MSYLCLPISFVSDCGYIGYSQTGPLGWSGSGLRTAAIGVVQMAEWPTANPRLAQGSHQHGSQPVATTNVLWN